MLPIKTFSWTMRSVLFAIVLGMFGLAAPALLAQENSGKLAIQLTNVINEPIVDYDKAVVPLATAAGGTFTVPVICHCGPAFVLRVEGCGTNSLRIESST